MRHKLSFVFQKNVPANAVVYYFTRKVPKKIGFLLLEWIVGRFSVKHDVNNNTFDNQGKSWNKDLNS